VDQDAFDRLSRQVSNASRRGMFRTLVAGGLAAGWAALRAGDGEASQTVNGCRVPGQGCDGDKKCCSGQCREGVCKCLERGKSCLVQLSQSLPIMVPNKAICCSSKCSRGTRKCK
jgi:hypothetical protein